MNDARSLTAALGGSWHGSHGIAACPLCQPERRHDQHALTISDGSDRLLAYCFKSGCDFRDILAAAGVARGTYSPPDPALAAHREAERKAETERKAAQARTVWDEAQPINGTLGETYLRSRGIIDDLARFPDLRFNPRLACVVALIRDIRTSERCGLHRTFLDAAGRKVDRKMLGRAKGGCVKLCPDDEVTDGLGIAEGIETALHVLQTGWSPVWACLSAGTVRDFPVPPGVEALTVFADHDESGTGERAARQCCARWRAAGREALAIMPETSGHDFADGVAG